MVVQASTGGVSDMNIQERCNPLDYPKVESASLNGGSTNLGEAVYINSFDDIRYCETAVIREESFRKQKFLILECYIIWQW